MPSMTPTADATALLDIDNLDSKHRLLINAPALVAALRNVGAHTIIGLCNFMRPNELKSWREAGLDECIQAHENADGAFERACIRAVNLPNTSRIVLCTGDGRLATNLASSLGRRFGIHFSVVARKHSMAKRLHQMLPVEFYADKFVVGMRGFQ